MSAAGSGTAAVEGTDAGVTAAAEAVLAVEGLRTHFFTRAGAVKAVDDVSFSVKRGEVLGLVGESGSGKSMTGYSIMGLIDPPGRVVEGRILLNGVDLRGLGPEALRRIASGPRPRRSTPFSRMRPSTTRPGGSMRPMME